MSEGLHPVVQLLLARMESHPDEFVSLQVGDEFLVKEVDENRWWRAMSEIQEYGSSEEKEAIAAKLRVLRLQRAHEWALDELCNGDERRRKERERHERDKQYYAMAQAQAQAYTNLPIYCTSSERQLAYDRVSIHTRLVQLGTRCLGAAYPVVA